MEQEAVVRDFTCPSCGRQFGSELQNPKCPCGKAFALPSDPALQQAKYKLAESFRRDVVELAQESGLTVFEVLGVLRVVEFDLVEKLDAGQGKRRGE
jgi:hypothetical protein